MPGLDPSVLDTLDPDTALARILNDVKSDFVLAPHYSAVFANIGDQLWQQLEGELRSGLYEPSLPVTLEVPKPSGLTRPGSILTPRDRLIYQLLADRMAAVAEGSLDRSSVFSNVLVDPDPQYRMFAPAHECWRALQEAIRSYSEDPALTHAIKADVGSYFERIYQHNLVNLLEGTGCERGAVNLLEKLLLAWMEKDSHGIIQGVFPSDFLGSFYLLGIDSDLSVRDLPFARYVDDLYIFFESLEQAQRSLVHLCRMLRAEGLHLNERKSGILETGELIREETELDAMFQEAREEVESELYAVDWYGFQTIWLREEEIEEFEIELEAVQRLYGETDKVPRRTADKIERFCLPYLASSGSSAAAPSALGGVVARPHLAKIYCSYLATFTDDQPGITEEIEQLLMNDSLAYDWQMMWAIATIVRSENASIAAVNAIIRILRDLTISPAVRALAAIAAGKLGHAGQRRNLRHHYSDEPSDYVRSAILFASRYFPRNERNTALAAWSGHSPTNILIAEAVRELTR